MRKLIIMIRVLMFVLGVIAFGVGLHECRTAHRVVQCSEYERGRRESECYKKTPGTEIHHDGVGVEIGGAGGMAAGLFFVVMALVGRKK